MRAALLAGVASIVVCLSGCDTDTETAPAELTGTWLSQATAPQRLPILYSAGSYVGSISYTYRTYLDSLRLEIEGQRFWLLTASTTVYDNVRGFSGDTARGRNELRAAGDLSYDPPQVIIHFCQGEPLCQIDLGAGRVSDGMLVLNGSLLTSTGRVTLSFAFSKGPDSDFRRSLD